MSELGFKPQNEIQIRNQESFWKKTKNFFEDTWDVIKDFFEEMGKFFSRNKYKFGLFLGALTIAGAVTASVFFGPALYTAITGLSAAVFPALAAITTGLAATIPFVALAIIAVTIVAAFALGLYFTIDSTRGIKAQKELSGTIDTQPLIQNQDEPNQDEPNQDEPNQGQPNQDQSNQDEPNQDEPNQDEPNQGQPNQDQSNQDQPNQDQPNQDQLNQDQLNPDKI